MVLRFYEGVGSIREVANCCSGPKTMISSNINNMCRNKAQATEQRKKVFKSRRSGVVRAIGVGINEVAPCVRFRSTTIACGSAPTFYSKTTDPSPFTMHTLTVSSDASRPAK
jgi:hypothetical protein